MGKESSLSKAKKEKKKKKQKKVFYALNNICGKTRQKQLWMQMMHDILKYILWLTHFNYIL